MSMEEVKKISVVVAAYNSKRTIGETIEALLSQDWPKNKLEIIVVDDGSTDKTAEIVKNYPVKYLYQENKGPATARNYGWRSARGEIICFTDSDCVPEKEWISKIINRYTSDDIAGVGGSYDIINSDNLLARCVHEEIIQRHSRSPKQVNYLGGFNVSYRRSVLEEVGGFDESYPDASAEDNELAYKVVKRGYKLIFEKDIKVGHYHPAKLSGYLKRQMKHGFWRMKLYRDHPDMSKGDVYAGLLDFIKPPLAILILSVIPFLNFKPAVFIFALLLLLQTLILLAMPLKIMKRTRRISYIYLWIVTFFREFYRGIGMFIGILRFRLYNYPRYVY